MELTNAAIAELLDAVLREVLPRRSDKRASVLRGIAAKLDPEAPIPLTRGKAAARKEASEWFLHRMPDFLGE